MRSTARVSGEMRQCETPDWGSLEDLLGSDDLCAHFMWMHDVELEDGTILNAYKHRWTRRYLHLADDGRAFRYTSEDRYEEVDSFTAIRAVFESWDCCEPTPTEEMALRSALRRASIASN